MYTPAEVRALTLIRDSVEKRAPLPDLRDVFLCHAWDDRQGAAMELHDLLESHGVKVWFSEKDVALRTPLLREIDRGLAKLRVGIVLVTLRCCAASKARASPTKSYRRSSRVTNSSPLCATRRTKLSAMSAARLVRARRTYFRSAVSRSAFDHQISSAPEADDNVLLVQKNIEPIAAHVGAGRDARSARSDEFRTSDEPRVLGQFRGKGLADHAAAWLRVAGGARLRRHAQQKRNQERPAYPMTQGTRSCLRSAVRNPVDTTEHCG
ncbi:toll/interleukin-1 receptor domain-containing protein [Bradyrhizobium zhanjiangense]|uniref:toll/interleukin-1 receptor domain-containing protein n=1 Tax=Bradyrhizobium zhanjiangense TaxID=1325107 RepID=UPI001FE00E83|nr:toll/interleukin-1 receptor domain-containing protein [Bradyrhizobium zhanjiangense]